MCHNVGFQHLASLILCHLQDLQESVKAYGLKGCHGPICRFKAPEQRLACYDGEGVSYQVHEAHLISSNPSDEDMIKQAQL